MRTHLCERICEGTRYEPNELNIRCGSTSRPVEYPSIRLGSRCIELLKKMLQEPKTNKIFTAGVKNERKSKSESYDYGIA